MSLTIGLLTVAISAVWRDLGEMAMRGSCNCVARLLSIIPEHKHPLSTRACTIVKSFIKALTRNGVVFNSSSLLATAQCSWERLDPGAFSFPTPTPHQP